MRPTTSPDPDFRGHRIAARRERLTAFLQITRHLGFSPSLAFDIGTHPGKWADIFKAVFSDCELLRIEPVDSTNSVRPDSEDDEEGVLTSSAFAHRFGNDYIAGYEDMLETGSLTTNLSHASRTQPPWGEAPLGSLDELIERIGGRVPDVLKIETDGYGIEILRGSERVWDAAQLVFLEASGLQPKSATNAMAREIALLTAKGFIAYDFTSFVQQPGGDVVFQCEIAFVRRGGAILHGHL